MRSLARTALVVLGLTFAPAAGAATYPDDGAVRDALRAVPGVRDALDAGRHRRAAVLVNRWLAPRVAAAYDASALLPTFGSPAHELLDAFAARAGGVYCDGAADALVASLRLLGIPAFRLDFGHAADGLTHTTVVVRSGGRHWLVDPTFALDLRGADGRPLDLVAAWQATADGARAAVRVRTGALAARPMVGAPEPDAVCADGADRWTMCALPTYLGAFAPAMRRAGYPTGEHGLLTMSLRSPLIGPDFYGVPPALAAAREAVRREPRPVRVAAVGGRAGTVVVTVRNVRRYAVPAIVTLRAGRGPARRAAIVPPGARRRVAFRVDADGTIGVDVKVASS
jgi:hypothetical protein